MLAVGRRGMDSVRVPKCLSQVEKIGFLHADINDARWNYCRWRIFHWFCFYCLLSMDCCGCCLDVDNPIDNLTKDTEDDLSLLLREGKNNYCPSTCYYLMSSIFVMLSWWTDVR